MKHDVLLTIEEGASGGFSASVLTFLANEGLLETGLKVRPLTLPDRFIAHGSPADQYEDAGLTAKNIMTTVLNVTDQPHRLREVGGS